MTERGSSAEGGYRPPQIFDEAVARGFAGFQVVHPQDELIDPTHPDRRVQPHAYTHQTIINGRTRHGNKACTPSQIEEWKARAEQVLQRGERYEATAVIGGMPVLLQTNSPHLINFWRRNWYLTDGEQVREASERYAIPIVKLWAAVQERDPESARAFYCGETNEAVFWNTDYYGQVKSWALGAAGVELSKYDVHSIHGACVEVNGKGIVIVAPTGTGKSTYTDLLSRFHEIDSRYTSKINSDDWVYVRDGIATPSERHIYVRTDVVADSPSKETKAAGRSLAAVMREILDRYPAENVPVRGQRRLYRQVPNSRCMIDPADIATLTFETRIHLLVLLRRDDHSPFEKVLDSEEALQILEEGEYTIQPGSGPREMWGQVAYEPWYNPYLLRPDREFERRMFASYSQRHGIPCVIYNTGARVCAREFGIDKRPEELTDQDFEKIILGTARRMLDRLEGL